MDHVDAVLDFVFYLHILGASALAAGFIVLLLVLFLMSDMEKPGRD